MRQEVADLAFPILRAGILLRKRLGTRKADEMDMQREQETLKMLLNKRPPEEAAVDFLGDARFADPRRSIDSRGDAFLGIRYALTCWLDEIIIQDDIPWKDQWNENKLEESDSLFRTNDRAWKFWEQAKLAAARGLRDAQEVFYLCVLLGFRGNKEGEPAQLQEWRQAAEAQLEERSFSPPTEIKPKYRMRRLRGVRRKQSMLVFAIISAMIIIVMVVSILFYPR
ncbi:MAG: DotU family type IV/VI secretion system protein [Gemmataceae bacterium]|nr:DotU family type IV/VI secretion system protein [Gemmataceae bacterium]